MSRVSVWLYHVVFCITCALGTDYDNIADEVVIAWNLKWKTDGPITPAGIAAQALARSWVKIVDRNASRGERHEYTIQSLVNNSIKLMVPNKKLTNFTQIKVYDYTNSTFDLMIRKRDELKQNPLNHVLVLPSKSLNAGDSSSEFELDSIFEESMNPLFARGKIRMPLNAVRLRYILIYIYHAVPDKVRDLLFRAMRSWAARHETHSHYFLQIWTGDIGSEEWIKFAVDTHRNTELLQKLLQTVRVFEKNPRNGMRDTDWLENAKQKIGAMICRYWMVLNDPKQYGNRQYLHVLWKSNYETPGFEWIDMSARDLFSFDSNGEIFVHYSGNYAPEGIRKRIRIKFYQQHAEEDHDIERD